LLIFIDVLLSSSSVLCKLSIPPTILLLSVSSSQSLELLLTLDKTFYPLRTVYLLDAEKTGSKRIKTHSRQRFELNNLRRFEPMDWQWLVREVASFVPHIVADARFLSAAVQSEISHIVKSRTLIEKTVVLTNADGSTPGIKTPDSGPLSEMTHCTPDELIRVLHNRGVKRWIPAEAIRFMR
jgi:hypothetical protein